MTGLFLCFFGPSEMFCYVLINRDMSIVQYWMSNFVVFFPVRLWTSDVKSLFGVHTGSPDDVLSL